MGKTSLMRRLKANVDGEFRTLALNLERDSALNGMGLLGQPASVVFLVNGIVLLLAAGVDVVSRRRSAEAGR